ncbi:MAG: AAA family ATPase [Hyphomicrobiaceae bacterium]|nr:AAA family ATPase [Hyphomicrobiaceae bacterium]
MAQAQDEIVAYLSNPKNWPGHPDKVDVVDTHGARVFLAGDSVIKIKRAVKLPYLDFSTLDLRKRYCHREFAINSPGAGDLYRDVVPITRERDGGLLVNGTGTPVEWAVRMHRFDQRDLLKSVTARGALTPQILDELADAIARYHANAPAAKAEAERMSDVASGVLSGLEKSATPDLSGLLQDLRARFQAVLAATQALRTTRAESGHIRRCHGDLHLANIVLWKGQPVLFDALEFDEALATVDTMYDFAFLLMDLERTNARAAANALLNRYLWRTQDISDVQALRLLPLFMSLRACVRALVALDRLAATHGDGGTLRASAHKLLGYAHEWLQPPPPRLIVVAGLSGTGKTTLARALAPLIDPAPGALHLRSDMERKALAGVEPTDRLPPSAYSKQTANAVYDRLIARGEAALRAGHSVIIDAVMADPSERDEVEALAQRTGVPFFGLWLEGDAETLKTRVENRVGDASDATSAVVEQQLGYDIGNIRWTRLDATASALRTLSDARGVLGIADRASSAAP